jgi:hypothetical protein
LRAKQSNPAKLKTRSPRSSASHDDKRNVLPRQKNNTLILYL